jgi:hypothetical protein
VTVTSITVEVDFRPIDSENPASFGSSNAYSNEVSMSLISPDGTVVLLFPAGQYNNNGAVLSNVIVLFDDSSLN